MGNVSGQDELVTKQELAAFYQALLPYLGGSSSGGGTTYAAGDGINITEDVIAIDPMPAEDIDEVVDIIPSGGRVAVTGYVPLGTLISYYGETAPRFFLACDGTTYNKADYPELAEHLLSLTNHSQYEVDGDDTKFKVPDLSGEFLRGTGTNSHSGNGNGATVGTHQNGTQIANEVVGFGTNKNAYLYKNDSNDWWETNKSDADYTAPSILNAKGYDFGIGTTGENFLGSEYFTVRPTNTSVLFCIAYKDIYSNPINDYSTDEKVVGTWFDGETIYQRTFVGKTPTTVNSAVDFASNISSIGIQEIVSIDGYLIKPESSTNNTYRKANSMGWNVWANRTAIRNSQSDSAYLELDAYITIQYTKTT